MSEKVPGFVRWIPAGAGRAPQVSGSLTLADHLGACFARWGINRMTFMVPPGLYAIGAPDSEAPVVVTANYKMSYDLVRRALCGRNVWLLVLETYGINVWCAAGKGTFGTGELVHRIEKSGLDRVVGHRRLILPILGAAGVSAHRVKQRSGFDVTYATMRAADLPAYLDRGGSSTPAMRELRFNWYDRLVLIPVELVLAAKPVLPAAALIYLVTTLVWGADAAATAALAFLGAVCTGVAIGPLLLPLLPTRSFAVKGAFAGALYCALLYALAGGVSWGGAATLAAFLALPAVSSFYTLNFTGCTTYTSKSGVKKEMRLGLPVMAGALGGALFIVMAGRLLV
ncbi:acetyl-CoA synthase subunit gamma [Geomonas nitrogeniifigens]|uniref:Acetyl-CoA synthase subunit gamma n=1 Tax=Geomonas diazotrophica TaxID=2843197 RepID=A0ABX8JPW2_9BACT|nr:acetyl-CoA synthase subunit gamma [Geomonas nitrogeniifigens]QXE88904.1 acetyl-CoA synthase subunit gamma [Geomonas nitrogeniifigens]